MKTDNNAGGIRRMVGRVAGFLPAAHYAAVGGVGAAVALAPEASATPIQSSVVNLVIPLTTAGVYINAVTGVSNASPGSVPGWDINPYSPSNLSWFSPGGSVYMFYPGGTTPGNLDLGETIDGTATFGQGTSSFGLAAGQWKVNATNYLGFKFIGEDSLTHYGWASVIVGATATDPVRNIGQIWYESSANTGIAVGAPSSGVPEPGTGLLLSAGLAGLLAFRRQRRHTH